VAVLAFAVATVGFGVAGSLGLRYAPHETATTTGTVTAAGVCGSRGAHPGTAEFTLDGVTYTTTATCDAKVGSTQRVQYDPLDPSHSNDSTGGSVIDFIIAAVALIVLIRVILSVISLHRTPILRRGHARL